MMKYLILLIISSINIYSLCTFCERQENRNSEKEVVRIILDTDMGSDCDDVGALALLHKYADLGLAEIIGCMYSSGKVPFGAGIIEAINIYYGRPDIPIGAYYGDEVGDSLDKMTSEKLVHDTTAFRNKIIYNTDAQEQTQLNRRLLMESDDNSIIYITIGHTKGVYELLISKPDSNSPLTGYELVNKKVKKWIAMGGVGAINKNQEFVSDWNLFSNGTAKYSKYLFENFPKPIYVSDGGTNVLTGQSLKYTSPGNIVRTAYRDWLWNVQQKTLDDQRSSWDLLAVYFAVEGLGDFLEFSGQGRMEVDLIKGVRWRDEKNEIKQYFVQQKLNTDQSLGDYLNKMIGETPVFNKE